MDFDEDRLYYSHQQLQTARHDQEDDAAVADATPPEEAEEGAPDLQAVRRHFREFLRK
jgi:hypothetical protein